MQHSAVLHRFVSHIIIMSHMETRIERAVYQIINEGRGSIRSAGVWDLVIGP
jgi:hypothetical protein